EADKSPTESIRRRLTNASLRPDANPGRVWTGELILDRQIRSNNIARTAELNSAFEKSIDNAFVNAFWSDEYLSKASELMASLNDGDSIGNAANGKPVHAIIATDLVTPS